MTWDEYLARQAMAVEAISAGGAPNGAVVFSVDRFVETVRVPVGGFADRVKGIASTFLCAAAVGRPYFIDWKMPTPLTNTYVPAGLEWRVPESLIRARPAGRRCDWVDYGLTEDVIKAISSGRIEEDLFQRADLVTMWANLYRPDLLRDSPHAFALQALGFDTSDQVKLMHQVFSRLFRFSASGPVADKAAEFQAFRYANPLVVGVQFRTGGDGKWEDPTMDSRSNTSAIGAAALRKAKSMGSRAAFFVTTDSVKARDTLVELLSPHGPVFIFDIEPMHVDRSSPEEAALLADYVPAEFNALSLCDTVVIGNGGFGLVASWSVGKHPIHYGSVP